MLARAHSYTLIGLEALPVEVEIDAQRGLPSLSVVGLPDQAVKEARERVRSAVLNSQFQLPKGRVTINLAPADLKKEGGLFDLAMALGLLAVSGQLEPAKLDEVIALGELALDGSLRPVAGVLPMAMGLRTGRRRTCLVPAANAHEAAVVKGIEVIPIRHLQDAVGHLDGEQRLQPARHNGAAGAPPHQGYPVDFSDVKGQALAKRALEVAVAGSHHVLLKWT